MDFTQSRTFMNLQRAFEGELMSSTRYRIDGIKARQDGYIQIGNVFDIIAGFEREHATIWLQLINQGTMPSTLENLRLAAASEEAKGNDTYRQYAETAREEGYIQIEALFNGVANIELNHEVIFENFANDIENNEVFCKRSQVLWICINCGNILGGVCAPAICPICGFPQGYYQVYDTNV
ncbi:rubrerythrin family protein [Anaerocolumna sp. AGMB13020]|uniref:rubrerythrin family protein n=1 Tax=Anaerocolumna sp. AGMB13020 TaxID=3081750 RepID=UPI002953610E|nr:rubrerythrin family protein [Anaerocolumna sp. AGMB13020]WOO38193.1 rubrerythrin family protein [Anaerocolumna sp. AGMB13020]